ncbi:hypothetical protein U3A58_10165 [Algoriphagus sp. C2-6-M1]|nr:hypothetical protein [Algoriphagus sp. C2-6-M1]MEB2780757.1 hypothetical protein [Algoriphagus sp. C2-6-M1]
MKIINLNITIPSFLHSGISRLDRDIDALVYELYGLTLEEISIVEGVEG